MSHVILVAGATSGIGAATAARLSEEGHTVYGAARKPGLKTPEGVKERGKTTKRPF